MRRQLDKLAVVVSRAAQALGPERGTARAIATLGYLTERAMLEQHGRPLSETAFYNTKIGPMGAGLYELLAKGRWPNATGLDEKDVFSRAELELVNSVVNRFKGMDEAALVEYTKSVCPEWREPKGKTAVEVLPLTTIWGAMQFDPETVDALETQWLSHENLSKSWEASRGHEQDA